LVSTFYCLLHFSAFLETASLPPSIYLLLGSAAGGKSRM
jgi:hypothetical protein